MLVSHSQRAYKVIMNRKQLSENTAGVEVPDSERLVVRTGEQKLARRMEDKVCYPVVMSDERKHAATVLAVPELDNLVSAT
jgi:RNase H-fold protein (predicted Holliday junction resolvase)